MARLRLGGSTGNNLVRIDCPLNVTEVELGLPITPVVGTLCFFGRVPGTYAGNFDVNGSFWCGAWDDGIDGIDGMSGGGGLACGMAAFGCFPNVFGKMLGTFKRGIPFG